MVSAETSNVFFEPHIRGSGELDEVEAAEEIDAGLVPHPRLDEAG